VGAKPFSIVNWPEPKDSNREFQLISFTPTFRLGINGFEITLNHFSGFSSVEHSHWLIATMTRDMFIALGSTLISWFEE
jgi:hypothetical protein